MTEMTAFPSITVVTEIEVFVIRPFCQYQPTSVQKNIIKGPFSLRAWKSIVVYFIDFFCARFNRRSIKETKNALPRA